MLNLKEAFEERGNLLFGATLILAFLILGFFMAIDTPDTEILTPTCGDGTPYGYCSEDEPYFCEEGILVEKASVCGCSEAKDLSLLAQDDSCVSSYHVFPKEINISYVFEREKKKITFNVFEGVKKYVSQIPREISFEEGENISKLDFKIKSLNDSLQREAILPLVKKIQGLAPKSKIDQARIAISMIQNIPYGFSNENVSFFGEEINYSRYPYEVLYENEGICGEKSQLLALVLKELGYKTAIFYFPEENHEAVGIGCPEKVSFNDSGFCFVETSGPAIISDSGMEYSNGEKLDSNPEVYSLSDGISLPRGLEEYGDAKDLQDIRERNFWGFLKQGKKEKLEEKYHLVGEYNLI